MEEQKQYKDWGGSGGSWCLTESQIVRYIYKHHMYHTEVVVLAVSSVTTIGFVGATRTLFLGSLTRQTGRCALPPPLPASLLYRLLFVNSGRYYPQLNGNGARRVLNLQVQCIKGMVQPLKRGVMGGINRQAFKFSTFPHFKKKFFKDPSPLNSKKRIRAA